MESPVAVVDSEFNPDRLFQCLRTMPQAKRHIIALSGGVDSMTLLHARHLLTSRLPGRLVAVHVNHGLSGEAGDWETLCQSICERLAIPFQALHLDAGHPSGRSPEAWARRQRYQALGRWMQEGDLVLTAHHQDDQAETVLIQLLRGAGPHGLAAMPAVRRFGSGWLGRPLLEFRRDALIAYASQHELTWVDDRSNQDLRYDRNFIRHQVLPLIRRRWGACTTTLARAAKWQADAVELLDATAGSDLDVISEDRGATLSVSKLMDLGRVRQRAVLRHWIKKAGYPVPSAGQLEQVLKDALRVRRDSVACVSWFGARVRRYRDRLFITPPLPEHDSGQVLQWDPSKRIRLSSGDLYSERTLGAGVASSSCSGHRLEVRFRQGGERCRPARRAHRRPLKKLLQEADIPPWQRVRLPLIYIDDELAAVAGLFVCHPFEAAPDEEGWLLTWEWGG